MKTKQSKNQTTKSSNKTTKSSNKTIKKIKNKNNQTMQKTLTIIITLLLSVFLSACSGIDSNTKNNIDAQVDALFKQQQSPIVFESEPMPIFVSIKAPQDLKLAQKVNIAIKEPINLLAAIDFADNSLSISADAGVDLNKTFSIKFNNQSLARYFDYLQNMTGYHLSLLDGVVYIKSVESKTWQLQSLSISSEQPTTSAKTDLRLDGDSSVIKYDNDSTSWQQIVDHVKAIMNVMNDDDTNQKNQASNSDANQNGATDNQQLGAIAAIVSAIVVDNQQLGTISAIGLPAKIKQVDLWLDDLIKSSNRQIHLQVQVLDVIVDNAVGQGINWNLISNQSSKFQIGNKAGQSIDGAGLISIGTPAGALINLGKKITLDVMLDLLAKQGKVRIENQPNITVTNGAQAYISTGDEFSFVSQVNATPDDNGNVITTSEIERMSVGVEMRVTPKILPDNRIVVSIVPIISSIKSFTTFTSGSGTSVQEFQTPNIALQKLATKVIVENGKTIHLGGLIATKVVNAAKGLPNAGIFDVFFRGVQKSLERREIVILITPTIVR
jgi:Flp pilus assembly secretin CpaC